MIKALSESMCHKAMIKALTDALSAVKSRLISNSLEGIINVKIEFTQAGYIEVVELSDNIELP